MDFEKNEIFNDELSSAEIEEFTKKLGRGLFNVHLTGGEPFMRGDIFEIISSYCRNTSAQIINIPTNGAFTEAVKRLIDKYMESGFRQKLMFAISIDDLGSSHDEGRAVEGLFDRAIRTYKAARSYNNRQIKATVGVTVTPYNYYNVAKLYDYLKAEGVDSFFAILMREEGAVKNIEKKAEVLEAYKKLTALINADQFKGETVGMGEDLSGVYLKARTNLINNIVSKIFLRRKSVSPCMAGGLFGVMRANGDVFPCEMLNNGFKLGNIRDYGMDFMKLWGSDKARQCRSRIKKSRCTCTFECAWSVNIISNIRFIPQLFFYLWKNIRWQIKRS